MIMSVPEYYQKAEDHQSILLLIKFLNLDSELRETEESEVKSNELFNLIHDELVNVNVTKINGNLSYERTIRLRFKKDHYDQSNNEWGDFQAHRKLFGLITIGIFENCELNNEDKIEEFYKRHKNFADTYSTILDSRCLLLKVDSSKQTNNSENLIETNLEDESKGYFIGK